MVHFLLPCHLSIFWDINLGVSLLFCKTQLDLGNTSACFSFFFPFFWNEYFFPLEKIGWPGKGRQKEWFN